MKGPNPPEKRLRKTGELAKVATEYDSTNHNIDDLYPENWGWKFFNQAANRGEEDTERTSRPRPIARHATGSRLLQGLRGLRSPG